jgi:hypothetical protein
MNVKESFLSLGHFQLNNGGNILFWEDKWLGSQNRQSILKTCTSRWGNTLLGIVNKQE